MRGGIRVPEDGAAACLSAAPSSIGKALFQCANTSDRSSRPESCARCIRRGALVLRISPKSRHHNSFPPNLTIPSNRQLSPCQDSEVATSQLNRSVPDRGQGRDQNAEKPNENTQFGPGWVPGRHHVKGKQQSLDDSHHVLDHPLWHAFGRSDV